MEHIGQRLSEIEQNMKLNTADPMSRYGFTQLPNFILRNPDISVDAKTVYTLLLSYAWHNNLCFPGQDRLAQDMGLTRPRRASGTSGRPRLPREVGLLRRTAAA